MSCFITPFQTGHEKRPDNVCYTFEYESKHADYVQMSFTGVLLLEALVTKALSLVVKLYMYTRRTVYVLSRYYPSDIQQPNVRWHNFVHLQDAQRRSKGGWNSGSGNSYRCFYYYFHSFCVFSCLFFVSQSLDISFSMKEKQREVNNWEVKGMVTVT